MKTSFPEKAKKFFSSWEFVLLLILFAEIVVFATKNPKFLLPRVLFGSLNDIISICIISLFVTFVMITGGIDIQAGSIVGLSSIVLGVAWQDGGMNIWAAVALAVAVSAVCGALSGYFVAYCGVKLSLYRNCPFGFQSVRYRELQGDKRISGQLFAAVPI